MSRTTQAPKREPDPAFSEAARESHPAYACCRVSHWTASPGYRLFGSDLNHRSGVTLDFCEASMSRGLSTDTHFAGREIFGVTMSHAQWAALIGGSHTHGGVPVTINHRQSGPMEIPPLIAAPEASKKEVHGEEMAAALREHLEALARGVAALGDAIDKGAGKRELRAIHEAMKRNTEQLPGSVKFVYDQFAEATENVAMQAKTEVEGYVNNVVHGLGLKSLAELPQLTAEKGGAA